MEESPVDNFKPDQRFLNQLLIASRLWSHDYQEICELMERVSTAYELELPPGYGCWPEVSKPDDRVEWPPAMVEWMREHGGF